MSRFFRLMACMIALAMVLVGCASASTTTTTGQPDGTSAETTADQDDELELYTFTHYFNYDWWGINMWAEDEVSKHLKEKFNIQVDFEKPDADPAAKLNIMISANDMPDSIMMDRGVSNVELARLGLLVDLEPLMANNSSYQENVMDQTIEMLKIDGTLYGIPNWSRKAASGGNDAWIFNERLYIEAGSPELETLEDLYDFAVYIRDNVPENNEGLSTFPVSCDSTADGNRLAKAFYRSYGGYNNGWYTALDGTYQSLFRDPVFKEASMEINRWWREGLFPETLFTDTTDQFLEKVVAGRTALLWYDQSQDAFNQFRKILMNSFEDDSYEIVLPFPYPPAEGLTPDDIYADHQATVGWNVTCITTTAEQPQRIFDLWTYLLTPEAAILQMYGPQGDLWDELDADGLPLLKTPESELSPEEINRLGLWFWTIPGQSDNVDITKFAVNAKEPPEKQDWVINNQANILTPIMWLSDEFNGIGDDIDPRSDIGINRTLIDDYVAANFPRMIMASTMAEAESIFDEILSYAEANGLVELEAAFDEKYKANVAIVGTGLNK